MLDITLDHKLNKQLDKTFYFKLDNKKARKIIKQQTER